MTVEILYLAWNRKAFTQTTFELLLTNTDWSRVERLVVYDDGSRDGTRGWLASNVGRCPVPHELRRSRFRSPPATMNDYLARTYADVFVKLDSDIAVPPGWIDPLLKVMAANEELELLGMQAGMGADPRDPSPAWPDGHWVTPVGDRHFSWVPSSHIGGVGAMRVSAFRSRPAIGEAGRFGFTEWQHELEPVRGWLSPCVRAIQLDLVPVEPWASLARRYLANRWAREWPPYQDPFWWDWLPDQVPA